MRLEFTLQPNNPGAPRQDVAVVCEPDAIVGVVLEQARVPADLPVFVGDSQLLRQQTVEESGLVSGCIVHIGHPKGQHRSMRRQDGDWQMVIVGGSNAGLRFPLATSPVTIGRGGQSDVVLDDGAVSKEHARIELQPLGEFGDDPVWRLSDLGSKNGVYQNGVLLSGHADVRVGQPFAIGASLLEIRCVEAADADVKREQEGTRAFNRPARIRLNSPALRVRVPSKPSDSEPWPFPFAQILAPLVLAGAMLLIFKRPEALLFGILSPVIGVASWSTNRKRNKRRAAATDAKYEIEISALQADVADFAKREIEYLQDSYPDPATVGQRAELPTQRLWERRATDPDAHSLRVGLKTRPSTVEIESSERENPVGVPVLEDAPVGIDLAAVGVLGIAGPHLQAYALARWLVAQLAVNRSPNDLQLVLLTDDDAPDRWEWWRWFPQSRIGSDARSCTLAGIDEPTREARLRELLSTVEMRMAERRNNRVDSFPQTIVVLIDGARALRSLPGVAQLLKDGPDVGVFAIAIDSEDNRLPAEGKARIVLNKATPWLGSLAVNERERIDDVLLDGTEAPWCESLARALAPLRCAGADQAAGILPQTARLVDLLGINLDSPDGGAGQISAGWTLNGRSTEMVIGVGVDGNLVLDLRRDGPHALVAGTTGAGKSELLQTMVASLAIASTPTALTFVLVDYKGESAFGECALLPHTVGILSNLDSHRTARALVHLEAELKRRERALRDLGATDIDAAWERDATASANVGLARLVIIVDEFAELVHELPDFVSGLVRVACVGRSLGVHLVLATQRPTGVITAEMKANTGLRIAMRMVDKGESSEVLERPDAATISPATPGRAFARTGGHAALLAFQTARVAGRRRGVQVEAPPPVVHFVPWSAAPYPLRGESLLATPGGATDLSALTSAIRTAAASLNLPAPHSPLVRDLSLLVAWEELRVSDNDGNAVSIGMEDHPHDQRQVPFTFDLEQGEHLLLAGSSRTGRSTALRTLATALAQKWSADDLHLYGLDFGNGGLAALVSYPHCGAIVGRNEPDRVERLLTRIAAEVASRQETLAAGGFGDIAEQRRTVTNAERLPYLVVLIDRWEGFTSMFSADGGSDLPALVLRLVRESASVGIRLIFAGDRSLLTDRIASHIENKLAFRLADRNDYRLIGVTPSEVADQLPPGRVVQAESGVEIQLAIPIPKLALGEPVEPPTHLTDQQAQSTYIRGLAAASSSARFNVPFRVDTLPAAVTFEQALTMRSSENADNPQWAMIGVGGDKLEALGVTFDAAANSFAVVGPARSGRSSALQTMIDSLQTHDQKHEFLIVCPRPSPLSALAEHRNVTVIEAPFTGEAMTEILVHSFSDPSKMRVLVIDDIDALPTVAEVDDVLRTYVRAASPGSLFLLVAGQTDEVRSALRGTVVEAKRSKRALILSPTSTLDGDLAGERIPRNFLGRAPAGRGVFLVDGSIGFLQVPKCAATAVSPRR